MSRIIKLTVIGAAVAGAAVGTVAFLRHRSSQQAELVDYDELADAAAEAIGNAPAAAVDAASDAVSAAAEATP